MIANTVAGTRFTVKAELAELGGRLIIFGQALQSSTTTVGELEQLASACGVALRLRTVAESGAPSDDQ